MRLNESTILTGTKCILVPYRVEHVAKYHEWMKNEEIQILTCSEPLSLEEEYEMQRTWLIDDDSEIYCVNFLELTFIIISIEFAKKDDVISGMCGDVNIFLNEKEAEIEVMIAEDESRKKGIAFEALNMIIEYSRKHLVIEKFVAKILDGNDASIALFEKLGFKKVKYVEVFKEHVLEML